MKKKKNNNSDIIEYYKYIYINTNREKYSVYNKYNEYLASFTDISDALYYRDLYKDVKREDAPEPSYVNFKKNNPYNWMLKYPIPDRLKKNKGKNHYGKGSITKKSKSSYRLTYGNKYICSCRTYEQAYYVQQEMIKCNWDKNKLKRILDDYPVWYTELCFFYQYINKLRNGWRIVYPRNNGSMQKSIEGYHNLEDALFERDFLVEHNWDYELLVETINDEDNPYYDMILPPYPERKIRHIMKRKGYEEELSLMKEYLLENSFISQRDLADKLNINDSTLREILSKYNTNWNEFKQLVFSGEDPVNVLELQPLIYKPDLSISNNANYLHVDPNRKSKYRIVKNRIHYGSYKTREIAEAIIKDLIACNWDKSKLNKIRSKHDPSFKLKKPEDRYIYNKEYGFEIRKKIGKRPIFYGQYKDINLARRVRDLLEKHEWDKKLLYDFKQQAKNELQLWGKME